MAYLNIVARPLVSRGGSLYYISINSIMAYYKSSFLIGYSTIEQYMVEKNMIEKKDCGKPLFCKGFEGILSNILSSKNKKEQKI